MIQFPLHSRKWLVLFLVFVLAGCSGLAAPSPRLELESCRVAGGYLAKCGSLPVFEDRLTQRGRKIDLQIAVIPARGDQPAPDPIFVAVGGPGASAFESADYYMAILGPANEKRDVVFVDQRGTGGSHKLECPQLTEPERQAGALRNCLPTLDGDPRAYTTAWVVDDFDDVRAALGYDQINMYGGSYGGSVMLVYLLRHGEHVRTAAMEGTTLLDVPIFERWPVTSQQALEALFDRCEADADCHAAFPDLRQEFTTVLARLDEAPITTPVMEAGQTVVLTSEAFRVLVHQGLAATETAVLLPKIIHLAYLEDWHGLAALLAPYQNGDSTDPQWSIMNLTILCHEPWARLRRSETPDESAGSYLTYDAIRKIVGSEEVCAAIPRPKEAALYGPLRDSPVPILFINGEADPQDPPENVAGARERYPNSLRVTAPGQSHNFTGLRCHASILADLFASGSTNGLDTACLAEVELPAFVK
jgi:pimeloyl-ACP methyl ester carboxylesterase